MFGTLFWGGVAREWNLVSSDLLVPMLYTQVNGACVFLGYLHLTPRVNGKCLAQSCRATIS